VTSAYKFAHTLAAGCAYVLMYVQFVHSALENEGGGFQLVYEGTGCLAWGVIFDRRRDRGVVCVFFIFNAGGSVCASPVLPCNKIARNSSVQRSSWSLPTYFKVCIIYIYIYIYDVTHTKFHPTKLTHA